VPPLRGVLETCLYAEDLPPAATFYAEVLGLSAVSLVEGRHAFFRIGSAMLLLFQPEKTAESQEVPPHGAHGPGHIAFSVAERDLPAWRRRFMEHGVPVEREIAWPRGGRSLYVRDPAGNSVELATANIWA
jgi:catechol 2,3-dioxygenase-like lactoylglutathione lyase family enzyme